MTKKVLVVEDNELNLKLFCDLLRAHEWAAEPVRDGREAVARARDFVRGAIAAGAGVATGTGNGPLNHGFAPVPAHRLPAA